MPQAIFSVSQNTFANWQNRKAHCLHFGSENKLMSTSRSSYDHFDSFTHTLIISSWMRACKIQWGSPPPPSRRMNSIAANHRLLLLDTDIEDGLPLLAVVTEALDASSLSRFAKASCSCNARSLRADMRGFAGFNRRLDRLRATASAVEITEVFSSSLSASSSSWRSRAFCTWEVKREGSKHTRTSQKLGREKKRDKQS